MLLFKEKKIFIIILLEFKKKKFLKNFSSVFLKYFLTTEWKVFG